MEIIDLLAEKFNLVELENQNIDYINIFPYKGTNELINAKLIKVVKARKFMPQLVRDDDMKSTQLIEDNERENNKQ